MRRRTGIHHAGALLPHDHVVWFGDGDGELYSVAEAAFADGARRGEKLTFVAEDPDPSLLSGVDGLERLLAIGQLELFAVDAVYGTGNAFSASAQLTKFEGVLADALADGYRGVRVVADNTPLVAGDDESFRRWLAWEQLTDRFQAASMVTGVCFFDKAALSDERQADLAALHPVRSASIAEPPFSVFQTATPCSSRVRSTPADRPLRVRGDGHVGELVSLIELATPHLQFERDANAAPTCTRCGDVIGVYEPTVIVLDGAFLVTSRAAGPDTVNSAPARYHQACYTDR